METTEEIIKRIVASFTAKESGELYFKNNQVAILSEQNSNQHLESISNILYRNFYWNVIEFDSTLSPAITKIQQEEYCQQLRAAYKTQVHLCKGWLMTEKDTNGVVYLRKKELIIRASPGQFFFEFDKLDNDYKASKCVTVMVAPSLNKKENYFYYLFGTTPDTGNDAPIVRFYFNLKPEGSIPLIENITHYLNLFEVPFSFKCCQNLADYSRSDSAVLYIAYNYFNIGIQLLEKIINSLKPFLKNDVPLFTLKLANGFSFAENPFGNLSFGQSRCNVIAAGICDCVIKKAKKEEWTDLIIEKIKTLGLDTSKMHLNAASVYNYNFTLANFND